MEVVFKKYGVGLRHGPINVAVLAGNNRQYLDYLRKLPSDEMRRHIFVEKEEDIRGLYIDEVEVIGTFWNRPDAGSMMRMVERVTGLRNIIIDDPVNLVLESISKHINLCV